VKIAIKACGICGSDVHYYLEGAIGDFIVKDPMILGHEAAGVIVEKGAKVTNVDVGDLVCMEPEIPNSESRELLEGNYHLDPDIVFWATPPNTRLPPGNRGTPGQILFQTSCGNERRRRGHDGTLGNWN
jgi:D-xylulose reductase